MLAGTLGTFTNTANICVYLKIGLSGPTNICFFTLSIIDLLVSVGAVLNQLTYNLPLSAMKLPSGAPVSEIGLGSLFTLYPCLGCSAWMTAILSIERCLCISAPLKVKEIVTSKRILFLILTMVAYQSVFIVLPYVYTGPPYNVRDRRRPLYFSCSYSFPSLICFFIVLVSTSLLVVRLKKNVEWRNEAAKQSNPNPNDSKELKAARSVVAICTIFIVCFTPNVFLFLMSLLYINFTTYDPVLGNLFTILYALSNMLQVLSSAVNIVIYYRMGTKYREVFNALFCQKRFKKV
ncbi:hypothetical protein RRG08_054793 [Elysia crispata]|uniref:G-protein coupled receptors family 1 profile domain-containing protein n=1 Tax=Elysia crispata TaxID=231223 RepID=A0AAE1DI33_9GAST|nr:hypothetical protein RRG08_054793 [Elysia crispata]